MRVNFLFLALCLGVVLTASSGEAQTTPQKSLLAKPQKIVKPQPTCTGKIKAVYCLEDSKGRLLQLAYNNTDTGLQNVGCDTEDWTARATKTYILRLDESIIRVRSCKAPKGGLFLNITTDANRYLTCGLPPRIKPKKASLDPTAAALANAEDKVADDFADIEELGDISDSGARHLLSNPGAATHFEKCTLSLPSKDPVWSNVTYWWTYNGTTGGFGRVQNNDPFFTYFIDGKTIYWLDYQYYLLQKKAFDADPANAAFVPKYYYDQVYPLAAIRGKCGKSKKHPMLEKLTGTCWNNRWNFTGNNTNQNLPIVVDPDLGEEGGEPVPCPVTQEEIDAFNKQLQEIGDRLVQASAGIIAAVIWQPYNPAFCRPTVGGNSTVTIAGSLVAGEGITADQVYSWLADNSQNNDLCTIQYEYDPPSTATQGLCTDTQFPNIFYVAPAAPGTNGARRLLQVYGRLPASQVVLSKSWRSL